MITKREGCRELLYALGTFVALPLGILHTPRAVCGLSFVNTDLAGSARTEMGLADDLRRAG